MFRPFLQKILNFSLVTSLVSQSLFIFLLRRVLRLLNVCYKILALYSFQIQSSEIL